LAQQSQEPSKRADGVEVSLTTSCGSTLRLCSRHLWSTWAVFLTTLLSWSLVYDVHLVRSSWIITSDFNTSLKIASRTILYFWIVLGCRLVKYMEHFTRHPNDVIYMPIIPLFGYYHSVFIKLRAMFSLQVVSQKSFFPFCTTLDSRLWRHH
jgi:hypothetical protein